MTSPTVRLHLCFIETGSSVPQSEEDEAAATL